MRQPGTASRSRAGRAAARRATPATAPAGFALHLGDTLAVLPRLGLERVPLAFADPPYFLSNGGVTCRSGRRASVNKGDWDRTPGIEAMHAFNRAWLQACRDVLDEDGTLWVSGTRHVIYSVGFAMQQLGYRLLNEITWQKPNPPPNLSCRYFTHATETVLWASKSSRSRHLFNYAAMKEIAGGRQMKSVWTFPAPGAGEKTEGRHPTQKPLALLERIILAASRPGDLVLDPFCGSGTTGVAALRHGRRFVGIENDAGHLDLARRRIAAAVARPVAPLAPGANRAG